MKHSIGVLINYKKDTDLRQAFAKARELELDSCQLCVWDMEILREERYAQALRSAMAESPLRVTALWSGWSGPRVWNFTQGPATIGLVPTAYRFARMGDLLAASDLASKVGIDQIATHVGFLPEDPNHPDFVGTVEALRHIAETMKQRGQYLLLETGQETPVTMLRTIEAVGLDNVGINFDTANLILYGKGNTADAIDVFGRYIMETHIKDGEYPTDGLQLGCEKPAGQGRADLPRVIEKLERLGFSGAFTIEREITGEKQIADIVAARDLLRRIFAERETAAEGQAAQ